MPHASGQNTKGDDNVIIPFHSNTNFYFVFAFTGSYVQNGSAAR